MSHTTKAAIYFLLTGVSVGSLLSIWGIPLILVAILCGAAMLILAVYPCGR